MAVQHTLFISANRLKKDTAIGGSVDENLMMPYILLAQEMQILPILGTDLYNALITKINANTLTGDYKTLLEDYIQKALVHFSFAELSVFMRLRFVNNAVVIMGSTDQSTSATYEDLKPLIDKANNAGQFFRQRTIDYLNDKGSATFPEFSSNTDAGDLSPTSSNYFAGINLDINNYKSQRARAILRQSGFTIYDC